MQKKGKCPQTLYLFRLLLFFLQSASRCGRYHVIHENGGGHAADTARHRAGRCRCGCGLRIYVATYASGAIIVDPHIQDDLILSCQIPRQKIRPAYSCDQHICIFPGFPQYLRRRPAVTDCHRGMAIQGHHRHRFSDHRCGAEIFHRCAI